MGGGGFTLQPSLIKNDAGGLPYEYCNVSYVFSNDIVLNVDKQGNSWPSFLVDSLPRPKGRERLLLQVSCSDVRSDRQRSQQSKRQFRNHPVSFGTEDGRRVNKANGLGRGKGSRRVLEGF